MENQTEEKKTVLSEFVEKYIKIENEQKLLAEDRKYDNMLLALERHVV